jgi:methylmalonyl-CoA/ethylmalonyl-CoA epimerase
LSHLKRISHLGFAVKNLDQAIDLYEKAFGLRVHHRWIAREDGMEAASFRVGEVGIELMQPLGPDTPVGRFIAKRGEGLHHVAYSVDDVAEVLDAVGKAGLETIDKQPRAGGDGRTKVGFLHPKSTMGVLTELEQDA